MDWTTFMTPSLGVGGLIVLTVVLILRGYLVPKTTVDQRMADKDEQITMWRTAYERADRALLLKDKQIEALLEGARTTTHVVEALSEAAGIEGSRRALAPPE